MTNQHNFLSGKTCHACLTGLLLLLVSKSAPAGDAGTKSAENSIPAIAGMAKIKIGFSTQQDLKNGLLSRLAIDAEI